MPAKKKTTKRRARRTGGSSNMKDKGMLLGGLLVTGGLLHWAQRMNEGKPLFSLEK